MTILDEVLIEEYDRCSRQRARWSRDLVELRENGEQPERQEQLQAIIDRIEFDQKKIRAALDVAGIDINTLEEAREEK